MSAMQVKVSQLIQNFRTVLEQVDSQTSAEIPFGGDSTDKQTYVSWIAAAEKAIEVAGKSTPGLQKLEQFTLALKYRTSRLTNEAKIESDPLVQRFKTLSENFGIPDDFAEKQIHHLCLKYPSFAKRLLEPDHEELADSFFKFCLQSPSQSSHRGRTVTHWVDIFVKYPEIVERLMASYLYVKLGMFPEHLHVDERGVSIQMEGCKKGKKVAGGLPLNFKKENFGDQFAFANIASEETPQGIILTVEQVFEQFEGSSPSDIDVSMKGVINLNSTLLVTRTNEKVFPIDPKDWTKHTPHVELTLPELKAKYPGAKEDLNFGFVLIAEKNGQTFFEFIKKTENGNFQVFFLRRHQKPGSGLDQQRRTFAPLTDEQGAIVIRKVAEDIEHCRKPKAEGKPIPPLNVQSYIDEVLGQPFYANIESLITFLNVEKPERINELTQARLNLDPVAFEEFLRPILHKLIVPLRDLERVRIFINTSLTTINSVLQKDGSTISFPPIGLEEVTETGKKYIDKQPDLLISSLVALGSICFEVLHPHRMTVATAEKDTPVLGRIFRMVEAIPWVWLRNLLNNFLLLILGPFRGYHYKTLVPGNRGYIKRLFQKVGNLKPEKYINHPSQLFESLSKEQREAIEDRIKNHLTVLAARGASFGVEQPQPPASKPPVTRDAEGDLFASVIEPPKENSAST